MSTRPDHADPRPSEAPSRPPTPTWAELLAQRWGDADASPGIDVPVDSWRWEVANWPIERWLEWNRLVDELRPAGANAAMIKAVQRLAYERIRDQQACLPETGGQP